MREEIFSSRVVVLLSDDVRADRASNATASGVPRMDGIWAVHALAPSQIGEHDERLREMAR
jgi:hypothetical protein